MPKVFKTMIVAAAIAPLARQLAAQLPSGAGMFVAPYSATGTEPATHFVNEAWIEEEFAQALSDPETLVGMLAAHGQTLPIAQAQAILSQATVSDEAASKVLADLGLTAVTYAA
jgi:hypothetical protein